MASEYGLETNHIGLKAVEVELVRLYHALRSFRLREIYCLRDPRHVVGPDLHLVTDSALCPPSLVLPVSPGCCPHRALQLCESAILKYCAEGLPDNTSSFFAISAAHTSCGTLACSSSLFVWQINVS